MSDRRASVDGTVEAPPAIAAGYWSPMAFVNLDGDVVECWACTLPAQFTGRLVDDLEGLQREAAEQASCGHGVLIEADRAMVDGRPAFRRVVRLRAGAFPTAVYVADYVVPLDGEIGLEVTVTCGALGGRPSAFAPPQEGPAEVAAAKTEKVRRGRKRDGKRIRIPRPGLAKARRRAGHTQESLAATIGLTQHTVSMWETGVKEPSASHRGPLADALRISLEELDRLIRGEPLLPTGGAAVGPGSVAVGPGSDAWHIDIDRLPCRVYPEVPIPATTLMLRSVTAGDDGLPRARRVLAEICPAIRIVSNL